MLSTDLLAGCGDVGSTEFPGKKQTKALRLSQVGVKVRRYSFVPSVDETSIWIVQTRELSTSERKKNDSTVWIRLLQNNFWIILDRQNIECFYKFGIKTSILLSKHFITFHIPNAMTPISNTFWENLELESRKRRVLSLNSAWLVGLKSTKQVESFFWTRETREIIGKCKSNSR